MWNVDGLSGLPRPVRRWLYFTLQGLIGSNIRGVWKEFHAWDRLDGAAFDSAVDERLVRILRIASQQSEYYRQLRVERHPRDTAAQWLQRFPPLTRDVLRDQFARLVIDDLRAEITSPESVSKRRYDWLAVKTGGTTGVPTTVIHDARGRDWGRAARLYALELCGLRIGTRHFRLWGSEQDLLKQQASLSQRLQRSLLGEIPLNAFRAREDDLRRHHAALLAHPGIHHLVTYVDAAVGLAEFMRDQPLPRPRLDKIVATAGTVTPEYRALLQETFGGEVFDKYGSRECSDIACECRAHQGLHVLSPGVFVEIVDDAHHPCPPGVPGRVLVTLLHNRSFPMVRYDIGDVAAWAEPASCPCGLPFPRLEGLLGRQDDLLVTEDGTLQTSVFVRHFVGVSLNRQLIREWQLEQTGRTQFVFRYLPRRAEGLEQNLREIQRSFQLVFGPSASIEMKAVESIPPSATGKVRWVVNSFRKRGQPRG